MICERCGQKVAAKQAREVKVGAGYKRLCAECANAWDGRHDRIEAGLAKREQDRRRHNSERLAALDADGETPARHARGDGEGPGSQVRTAVLVAADLTVRLLDHMVWYVRWRAFGSTRTR